MISLLNTVRQHKLNRFKLGKPSDPKLSIIVKRIYAMEIKILKIILNYAFYGIRSCQLVSFEIHSLLEYIGLWISMSLSIHLIRRFYFPKNAESEDMNFVSCITYKDTIFINMKLNFQIVLKWIQGSRLSKDMWLLPCNLYWKRMVRPITFKLH